MPFNDWDFYVSGSGGTRTTALTTLTGLPPMAGLSALQLGGQGMLPGTPGEPVGIMAMPEAGSPLEPCDFRRGSSRTLVRVYEAFGLGRQQVGIVCQWQADFRDDKAIHACYGLLLDGPQNLTAWERLMLCYIAASSSVEGQDYPIRRTLHVLDETPVTTTPAAPAALELTWHMDRGDADGSARLIGKLGTATDYSDLTTRVSWRTTDYPAWSQSVGSGVQNRPGLLVRYNAASDVMAHRIVTLWDQTQLDEIAATPMPALSQVSRKPLKADPDGGA